MTMRPLWILILHQNGELWIPKSMQPTFSKPFLRCKEKYKLMSHPIESISQRLLFLSHSVMSDSLWPHEPQHTRLPYPSLSPGVHSKLFSRWCCLTILSSTTLFSFCLQSFPASGSFPVSWLFTPGVHSIGASALAIVLSMNIRVDFLYNWLVWSPCCPRHSQESPPAP